MIVPKPSPGGVALDVLPGLLTGDPWNYTFLIGSVLIIVGIWQVTKVPKVKETIEN